MVEEELTQDAGKLGRNVLVFFPSFEMHSPFEPTPLSPLANNTLTPLAPSCAKPLHTLLAKLSGTVCSSSP